MKYRRGHVYYSKKVKDLFIYIGPLNGKNWVIYMDILMPYTYHKLGANFVHVGEM